MLLIDTSTGTVLTAEHCVLVPDSALTEAEWDALNEMTDSEVGAIARERGTPVLNAAAWEDRQTLDAIAGLLDRQEWDAEMLDTIAEWVRATGRTITDV